MARGFPASTYVAQRFDEINFTVARQVTGDGSKRYLVWIRRDGATAVHSYEAVSARDAIRQAREELAAFEALANTI